MRNICPSIQQQIFENKDTNPYYIVCPPFKTHSAGIVVLHRFCHMLNLAGYPAFMVIERHWLGTYGFPGYSINGSLITPLLTSETAQKHHSEGNTPIVIYPDATKGRPLKHGLAAIYMLNYLGLLGGEEKYADDAFYFSYSKKIALTTPEPGRVLFVPASDPEFWTPPERPVGRKGIVYYASKYKHFHGMSVGSEVDGAVEITRDHYLAQTKLEIRELFRTCEYFYCYENSALAIEAALCGCPVVFIPNKFLSEAIAEYELGNDGFSWSLHPDSVARAKATVHLFRDRYLATIRNVEPQLKQFIDESQSKAKQTPYPEVVDLTKVLVSFGYETLVPLKALLAIAQWDRDFRKGGFLFLMKQFLKRRSFWQVYLKPTYYKIRGYN